MLKPKRKEGRTSRVAGSVRNCRLSEDRRASAASDTQQSTACARVIRHLFGETLFVVAAGTQSGSDEAPRGVRCLATTPGRRGSAARKKNAGRGGLFLRRKEEQVLLGRLRPNRRLRTSRVARSTRVSRTLDTSSMDQRETKVATLPCRDPSGRAAFDVNAPRRTAVRFSSTERRLSACTFWRSARRGRRRRPDRQPE